MAGSKNTPKTGSKTDKTDKKPSPKGVAPDAIAGANIGRDGKPK